MTTGDAEWPHLTPEQQQRVEALQAARNVLSTNAPGTAPETTDIQALTDFILTGLWREREPEEQPPWT